MEIEKSIVEEEIVPEKIKTEFENQLKFQLLKLQESIIEDRPNEDDHLPSSFSESKLQENVNNNGSPENDIFQSGSFLIDSQENNKSVFSEKSSVVSERIVGVQRLDKVLSADMTSSSNVHSNFTGSEISEEIEEEIEEVEEHKEIESKLLKRFTTNGFDLNDNSSVIRDTETSYSIIHDLSHDVENLPNTAHEVDLLANNNYDTENTQIGSNHDHHDSNENNQDSYYESKYDDSHESKSLKFGVSPENDLSHDRATYKNQEIESIDKDDKWSFSNKNEKLQTPVSFERKSSSSSETSSSTKSQKEEESEREIMSEKNELENRFILNPEQKTKNNENTTDIDDQSISTFLKNNDDNLSAFAIKGFQRSDQIKDEANQIHLQKKSYFNSKSFEYDSVSGESDKTKNEGHESASLRDNIIDEGG